MQVRIEAPVFSSEGTRVGKVDRIVVDPRTMELTEFIVHQGLLLTHDRIVEPVFVDRVDEDGVHLRLTARQIDELPEFVQHEYVIPTPTASRELPYPATEDLSGAGVMQLPIFWRTNYAGHDFATAARFEFDSVAITRGGYEIRSNVSEDTVIVDEHTDVIACDGKKLGELDEVLLRDDEIVGIVVRSGLLHEERLRIPIDAVKSITRKRIRLNVTSAEVAAVEQQVAS